jgi:hypothetical protein
MKTIKELGALVKKKHPEYLDLSDEEVGRRIKQRYPDDYADFVDPASIAGLLQYYDPGIGRLKSWWRGYKSEGRGKMLSFITEELRSILEQGAMLEDAAIASKQKQVEFQSFVAHNQFFLYELQQKANLLDQAAKRGMTVETLQQVQIARVESDLRIGERQIETDEQIKLERELANIRLNEFKEREAIQLNTELRKMNEQVRLALIAKALSSHQRVMLVQELLDGLYKQIEEVEHSNLKPATQRRMIEDREAIISHFKGYRDAEGSRLLQTNK